MECRSTRPWLGLPLLHVAVDAGLPGAGHRRRVATGPIAIGDVASGVRFDAGGVAASLVAAGGAASGWHAARGGTN